MTINNPESGEQLRPISELDGYTVASGDSDPRGWVVVESDGTRVGRVVDLLVDTHSMKVRKLLIDREANGATASTHAFVTIDADETQLHDDARQVVVLHFSSEEGFGESAGSYPDDRHRTASTAAEDNRTLTRSEEELQIGKREVSRGEARISKHVETERVSEPITRRREEVVIERRPVEAGARAAEPIGEDEVRIPLTEEEVVVEKRPVVKEELVVGKRTVEERDVVEADVRREKFDIDRPTGAAADERSPRRSDRSDRS